MARIAICRISPVDHHFDQFFLPGTEFADHPQHIFIHPFQGGDAFHIGFGQQILSRLVHQCDLLLLIETDQGHPDVLDHGLQIVVMAFLLRFQHPEFPNDVVKRILQPFEGCSPSSGRKVGGKIMVPHRLHKGAEIPVGLGHISDDLRHEGKAKDTDADPGDGPVDFKQDISFEQEETKEGGEPGV